eukprot:8589893-Alexandrium_andersonii.AAC.1
MKSESEQKSCEDNTCSSHLPPLSSARIANDAPQPPSRLRPRGSAQRRCPRRGPNAQPGACGRSPQSMSCG